MKSQVRYLAFVSLLFSILLACAVILQRPAPANALDCSTLPLIDGQSLPTKFAGAVSVLQDNPTGFGDVTPPNPQDAEGNELDQMFLANDNTNLYIGITGNTERTDTFQNTVLVFIDTDNIAGTQMLSTAGCCVAHDTPGCGIPLCESCVSALDISCGPLGTWSQACVDFAVNNCAIECASCVTPAIPPNISFALQNLNNITLDFTPEFVIAVWNESGVQNGVRIDLNATPDTAGTALVEGIDFAVDNSNLVGVNSEPANDPLQQEVNAATAVTGFQFAIPLTTLGILSTDTINVQAIIASGFGFLSNQSLPPLNETAGFNGGGVNCIGIHDPNAIPPNIVDFSDIVTFPGLQHVPFTLTSPGAAPGGLFNGSNIPVDFPNPAITTQNNFTCFGDAAPFSPVASNGSEVNEIFISSDANKLYIGITGNIPSAAGSLNTILIFIDNSDGFGSQELFTGGFTNDSGALAGMNGVIFDTGFAPSWAIAYWRGGNKHNAVLQNLPFDADFELLQFSINTTDHTAVGFNAFSADLSNLLGVNNIVGDDPVRQELLAGTAIAGVQFSIDLQRLGFNAFSTNVKIVAAIVSGNGFISNQWLPPLNPTDPVPVLSNDIFSPALALSDVSITTNTQTLLNATALVRVTDLKVTVNLTHAAVNELNIDLRHDTTGRTVRLWQANATGANMNTTFANGGAALATWTAPGVGEFEVNDPATNSLLTFNDVDPNDGTWSLIIEDTLTGNTGVLNSWSLDLREDIGGTIPCLGFHNPVSNPINLSTAGFPGNQFLTLNLSPLVGAPTSFSGQNVPTAYLPNPALAIQNNHTCFGDSVEVPPASPPGSEQDQMFVSNTTDRLQVAVTGNLEENANAYILLLDTDLPTGSQTISGLIAPPAPEPLGGGGAETGLNGLILDPGFKPDWGIVVQRNDPSSSPDIYGVFLTDLRTNLTRSIGRVIRNSGSGQLLPAIPNGNGSELNQMFVQNDATNLYIGLTSNVEGNGNTHVIFLDTVAGTGSNVLSTNFPGFPGALIALNGDILDVGFNPDFAIVMDRDGGFFSAQLVDLVNTVPFIVTPLTFDTVIAPNTFVGDNTNSIGVNNNPIDDITVPGPGQETQQELNAATAIAGVQFAIDRASIGSPLALDMIKISAVHVSNTGFWSNQTLPGLGGGVANLGFVGSVSTDMIDQFALYTMADDVGIPFATPTAFDGANIPAAMASSVNPLATQDNFTGFGDSVLPINSGNPNCIQVAFDDGNLFGVTAVSAVDAGLAESGMEFDIPFADLGLTALPPGVGGGNIRIMSVLTGPRGFLSNQFLPPLGLGNAANLGNASLVNLSLVAFPGLQFLSYPLAPSCSTPIADIDGNGIIDVVVDSNALVGVLLGTNTDFCPLMKADVNNDTVINGLDIQTYVDAILAP